MSRTGIRSDQINLSSIPANKLKTSTFIINEQPSEIPDGTSVTHFNLVQYPVEGSEQVFLNGLLQNEGESDDYTISGKTIIFNEPPEVDSIILVKYYIGQQCSIFMGTYPHGKLYEWDEGGSWDLVASQFSPGETDNIYALCSHNGKLYAATELTGRLYQWNNSNAWISKAPILGDSGLGGGLVSWNGSLYSGTGNTGSNQGCLYKWNGSNAWTKVADQLNSQTYIRCMVIYNNEIYAGTYFGGRLFKFNGTNAWTQVAPKLGGGSYDGYITALTVYNNKIYGGTYSGKLYEWNGSNAWVSKLTGLSIVAGFCELNDKLYITNESAYVYEWDGISGSPTNLGQIISVTYTDTKPVNFYNELFVLVGCELYKYENGIFNKIEDNPSGETQNWSTIIF